jgi:hypothetical protein
VPKPINCYVIKVERCFGPYLGARYRRFLKSDNPDMDLSVEIKKSETNILFRWDVREVKPIYFHPSTRENSPVILMFPLSGKGWKAKLTFGYAPKESSEYDE